MMSERSTRSNDLDQRENPQSAPEWLLSGNNILNQITDGMVVINTDWRVTRANTDVLTLLECESTELIGANVDEIFHI